MAREKPLNRAATADLAAINQEVKDLNCDPQWQSRRWIYQQYDQRVGVRTVWDAAHPVAILRMPSGKGLSVAVGCRPKLMGLNTWLGAQYAIFAPAFKMSLYGFEPLAVTDCLNFGNPEKPETMRDFSDSVDALSEACEALNTPVISGNVSFYNETQDRNVPPTPATGMIGLRSHVDQLPNARITEPGQEVRLLRWRGAVDLPLGLDQTSNELTGPEARLALTPADFAAALFELREFSRSGGFQAAVPIEEFGISLALTRGLAPGVGLKLEADLSQDKWQQSMLYGALVVLSSEECHLEHWELHNLGRTSETGSLQDRLNSTIAPLDEWRQKRWAGFGEML